MKPRTCIPCEKIEQDCYEWYDRHASKLEEVKTKRADIVFIGDSITHFFSAEDGVCNGAEVWEEYYGKRNVLNLGYGFDRTQNMLWRIQHGELENQSPKLFVLNVGTNQFSCTPNYSGDTAADAFEGVKLLIETLAERFPQALILVMALFPRRGEVTGGATIQSRIDELNLLVSDYIRKQNRETLKFVDICAKMRKPDGSFEPANYADGWCHPNNAGYRIWAEAIEPEIQRILGEKN